MVTYIFYRVVIVSKTVIWDANYDSKNDNYKNAYLHVVLKGVICPQNDIVPYARHILPVKVFPI